MYLRELIIGKSRAEPRPKVEGEVYLNSSHPLLSITQFKILVGLDWCCRPKLIVRVVECGEM
jgi:hypothetical protein